MTLNRFRRTKTSPRSVDEDYPFLEPSQEEELRRRAQAMSGYFQYQPQASRDDFLASARVTPTQSMPAQIRPSRFPDISGRVTALQEELGFTPALKATTPQERQQRQVAFRDYRKRGGKLVYDQ